MPVSFSGTYALNRSPPAEPSSSVYQKNKKIPNYFGFWGQDLQAYFWNPSLAMLAARKQMHPNDDSDPPPLMSCPGLYSPPTNDHEGQQFRNPGTFICPKRSEPGSGGCAGVGVF